MKFDNILDQCLKSDWHEQLRNSSSCLEWLSHQLKIDLESTEVAKIFPPILTPHYVSLVKKMDLSDPILMQCLPQIVELDQEAEEDPLSEKACSPVPFLVHRYSDRVLLVVTNRCAMRCRHCMRKRLWHESFFMIKEKDIFVICDYLRKTPGVREVIISGGDPLLLEDKQIDFLLSQIFAVPSIEMVRIGTRVPVVLPQRLTDRLCEILGKYGTVWLATHFNHSQEFSSESDESVLRLLKNGVPVVNQTVLLRGINDDCSTLQALFTGLLKRRIKPYYLFHGDPIKGTIHFRTGIEKGLELMDQLRGRVSGLALPHFAIDLPEGGGKIRLTPNCMVSHLEDGTPVFRSWDGREIPYAVKI